MGKQSVRNQAGRQKAPVDYGEQVCPVCKSSELLYKDAETEEIWCVSCLDGAFVEAYKGFLQGTLEMLSSLPGAEYKTCQRMVEELSALLDQSLKARMEELKEQGALLSV